jgi:hypothetical protein
MLGRVTSLWRKSRGAAEEIELSAPEVRRNRQKNVKASPACIAAFGHIAKISGLSEAALFEDLVAQRWEELRRSGGAKRG